MLLLCMFVFPCLLPASFEHMGGRGLLELIGQGMSSVRSCICEGRHL